MTRLSSSSKKIFSFTKAFEKRNFARQRPFCQAKESGILCVNGPFLDEPCRLIRKEALVYGVNNPSYATVIPVERLANGIDYINFPRGYWHDFAPFAFASVRMHIRLGRVKQEWINTINHHPTLTDQTKRKLMSSEAMDEAAIHCIGSAFYALTPYMVSIGSYLSRYIVTARHNVEGLTAISAGIDFNGKKELVDKHLDSEIIRDFEYATVEKHKVSIVFEHPTRDIVVLKSGLQWHGIPLTVFNGEDITNLYMCGLAAERDDVTDSWNGRHISEKQLNEIFGKDAHSLVISGLRNEFIETVKKDGISEFSHLDCLTDGVVWDGKLDVWLDALKSGSGAPVGSAGRAFGVFSHQPNARDREKPNIVAAIDQSIIDAIDKDAALNN